MQTMTMQQHTAISMPFVAPGFGGDALVRPFFVVRPRAITAADVQDLLEAAGPLSLRDIAGGLQVSEREAEVRVASMVAAGALGADEWGRYRLRGALAA